MHLSALRFAVTHLSPHDIEGKRVLEVGSCDVNGGVRTIVQNWAQPSEYIGVDIENGPGVDMVCSAEDLIHTFGSDSFDTIITTEMLEHVRDWRNVMTHLKTVCRPSGTILLTTRSKGFHYHAYPHDFWRYEVDDMNRIFSDMDIQINIPDPESPGVFLKVRKPQDCSFADLSDIHLHSMITGTRIPQLLEEHMTCAHFQRIQRRRTRKAFRKKVKGFFNKK